jgi:hypothetical protein
MRVTGHQNFGRRKLEGCGIELRRMASNSEEDQGPYRTVMSMLMMMMDIQWNTLQRNSIWHNGAQLLHDQLCNDAGHSTITYRSIQSVDDGQVELCIEEHTEHRYSKIYVRGDVYCFTLDTSWEKQKWTVDSVRCSLLSKCKYITELTTVNKHRRLTWR